jgi:hypothetical protein
MTLSVGIAGAQVRYAISKDATPILNTPDFESVFGGMDGKSIKTDEKGLIRAVQFIALKGTVFEVIEEIDKGDHKVLKVRTDEYEYGTELYADSRFLELKDLKPAERKKELPPIEKIYEFLDKAVGAKYCWGGNYVEGISKMVEYYKPTEDISSETNYLWTLKGCDCSGLMYEATNGYTERNTSKLIYSGEPINIEGLSAKEIASKLKPLDMIVWDGHVIYVYDENTAIQSGLSKGGVVKTDLIETLKEVMKTRKPVNEYNERGKKKFVVRRWYRVS